MHAIRLRAQRQFDVVTDQQLESPPPGKTAERPGDGEAVRGGERPVDDRGATGESARRAYRIRRTLRVGKEIEAR